MSLPADLRVPAARREVFQRYYSFALRYRAHPGAVYQLLPAMAEAAGWDTEQRAWAAFVHGNTQNPATTWLLLQDGCHPDDALAIFEGNRRTLAWDTDRRYHRQAFPDAMAGYLALTERAGGQAAYWRRAAASGWDACWRAARAIPTFGRLSAWSYLEFLRILDVAPIPDADTLLLDDPAGSRSHRNGLLLLAGHDDQLWWRLNPAVSGPPEPDLLAELVTLGDDLLAEAQQRNPGHPDVSRLSLESALCTWKSWHLPKRRYAGVYHDMAHDRLRAAEAAHGHRFDALWDARAELPRALRLEQQASDPGVHPLKQNHYLTTGETPMLGHLFPEMWSAFDEQVAVGALGRFR